VKGNDLEEEEEKEDEEWALPPLFNTDAVSSATISDPTTPKLPLPYLFPSMSFSSLDTPFPTLPCIYHM
jgi:hypothetical protein